MVVERTQFLDMNMESAQVMTALGALLAEQGALKRADTLLRQALEFFWRELKGPHVAVARCYRVGGAEAVDYLVGSCTVATLQAFAGGQRIL